MEHGKIAMVKAWMEMERYLHFGIQRLELWVLSIGASLVLVFSGTWLVVFKELRSWLAAGTMRAF